MSHGDACASEAVGDGLCVDSELVGDVGQRPSSRVELSRMPEDLVVPRPQFAVASDTVAVEVARHGGAVGAELDGQLADGRAGLIRRDQGVDGSGGEAPLGRV